MGGVRQCATVRHSCATVRHSAPSAPQCATVRRSVPNRVRSATTEGASSQKARKTPQNLAAPPSRSFSQRHPHSRSFAASRSFFRFRFRPSESADEDYDPIRTWGIKNTRSSRFVTVQLGQTR